MYLYRVFRELSEQTSQKIGGHSLGMIKEDLIKEFQISFGKTNDSEMRHFQNDVPKCFPNLIVSSH